MENVPGLATGAHTQLLGELIDGFEGAGYRMNPPQILNAANFGVPQDRRRLFLFGARNDTPIPSFPEAVTHIESSRRRNGTAERQSHSNCLAPCPKVADAIGDLPDIEDHACLLTSDTLRVRLTDGSRYARRLRTELTDPQDFSYPRAFDKDVLTGCLRARHTNLSRQRFAATEPGTTEPVSRFFKLAWHGVCHTLRAGTASDRGAFSAPRPIHPTHPRCISVREAARLHSYPDWFRFHRTIWHGFRQIGNSVPPLLARALAASVIRSLGYQPRRPETIHSLGPEQLATLTMRKAAAYFHVDPHVIPPRKRVIVSSHS